VDDLVAHFLANTTMLQKDPYLSGKTAFTAYAINVSGKIKHN